MLICPGPADGLRRVWLNQSVEACDTCLGLRRKIIMHLYHCQYQQLFRCFPACFVSFSPAKVIFNSLHLFKLPQGNNMCSYGEFVWVTAFFLVEHAFV